MAYLFKLRIPKCSEASCRLRAGYEVRSSLLHDKERFPLLPAPLCLRHANKLHAWFEEQEAATPTTSSTAEAGQHAVE